MAFKFKIQISQPQTFRGADNTVLFCRCRGPLVAQFLAHNSFNFALLTDSFIVSLLNYWNFDRECKKGKHKTAFRAQNVNRTFKNGPQGLQS